MKTSLAPPVIHCDNNGRKFMDIVGAAYDEMNLSDAEAQNVNSAPGLTNLIRGFIIKNRSYMNYPDEYKLNSVEQQIDILRSRENFPFINPDPAIKYYREVYPTLAQPDWVEGPFVLLSASTLAKYCFPDATDIYCRAVNLGIGKLAASRPFYNWNQGQLTPDRLRRKARYAPMYERLYATQPGSDLIVVGGQYGKHYINQRICHACERMQSNELPAGALEGIIMALANPTRYVRDGEIKTDFPADEFRPGNRAVFSHSPFIRFGVVDLGFGMDAIGYVIGFENGVVSFCVPR